MVGATGVSTGVSESPGGSGSGSGGARAAGGRRGAGRRCVGWAGAGAPPD